MDKAANSAMFDCRMLAYYTNKQVIVSAKALEHNLLDERYVVEYGHQSKAL